MSAPDTLQAPGMIGAIRPIAPREEANWQLIGNLVNDSNVQTTDLGTQPFVRLIDSDEVTRMVDAGVRPSELVEALGERLSPDESGPMTVEAQPTTFQEHGHAVLGLVLTDNEDRLSHQRAKLREALQAITYTDILGTKDFRFAIRLLHTKYNKGANRLKKYLRNHRLFSAQIDLDGIVVGQAQDYAPDEPQTGSSMDGRTHPITIGDTNPENTEKVTDMFLLLDPRSVGILEAAQIVLGQVIKDAEPIPLDKIYPSLLDHRERDAIRRSGLTFRDAELIIHSILRGSQAQLLHKVAHARDTTMSNSTTTARIGLELKQDWELTQARQSILNLFADTSGRSIPTARTRMWPHVSNVAADRRNEAVDAISHLAGRTLRSIGVILYTVDNTGRHIHIIDTSDNGSPPPEPEPKPATTLNATEASEPVMTDDKPEEQFCKEAPSLDKPKEDTQLKRRRASLELTELHESILGAELRGPRTLSKLVNAMPSYFRRDVRRALQQLVAAGYYEQRGSTFHPIHEPDT